MSAFYWFAGPNAAQTLAGLLDTEAGPLLLQSSQAMGVVLALVLAASGVHAERRFNKAQP